MKSRNPATRTSAAAPVQVSGSAPTSRDLIESEANIHSDYVHVLRQLLFTPATATNFAKQSASPTAKAKDGKCCIEESSGNITLFTPWFGFLDHHMFSSCDKLVFFLCVKDGNVILGLGVFFFISPTPDFFFIRISTSSLARFEVTV